jgi:hypothetical protein
LDWSARFGPLGLSVVELSGDSDPEPRELEGADLICTTPEKFGARGLGLALDRVGAGRASGGVPRLLGMLQAVPKLAPATIGVQV